MARVVAVALAALVTGCGSAPPAPPPPPPRTPALAPARAVPDEAARRAELAAAHRALEAEQAEALAATCADPTPRADHPRCLPSCYPTEPADTRATAKIAGPVALRHRVCTRGDRTGPYLVADEIGPAALAPRKARGRFPPPHARGTWQADLVAALAPIWHPAVARGEVVRVEGAWRRRTHPISGESLACVVVAHYTKRLRRGLDACGADGELGCEAAGDAAARGANVVRYRLTEARALAAGNATERCRDAALEAVAVARGLPRWRQYMKLNVDQWTPHVAYRTRFDGVLDEDALFATAARLGAEAEAVYVSCGGAAGAPTTVAQEQSFHACW